jgi:hypothetical protein
MLFCLGFFMAFNYDKAGRRERRYNFSAVRFFNFIVFRVSFVMCFTAAVRSGPAKRTLNPPRKRLVLIVKVLTLALPAQTFFPID